MKTSLSIISKLLLICVMLYSCSEEKQINAEDVAFENILNSKNLDSIKAKKASLLSKQKQLSEQINLLSERIVKLDSNFNFPLVTVKQLKEQPFNHYVELQGNVTTNNVITVSAEFSGVLSQVYVKSGDKVKKGQLLAKIDDGGLSQQLTQMKIQRDLAKTTYERQKRLWEQNIGSEMQYLQAKSNYESQNEAIDQMQKQLAKTNVTAPLSGSIDNVITEKGNLVAPGTPILRLVNLNDMYIKTDVPERFLTSITLGKPVQVAFPILNKNMTSHVRQVSDYINPANRTYSVEIPVKSDADFIKPNLTAKLKINDYTNPSAILIPQYIISEDADGEQYVFILNNVKDGIGEVKRVTITTGKPQGDVIEVLTGLEDNMIVVQEGARTVKEGETVKIEQS